jgi:hypothetical protein
MMIASAKADLLRPGEAIEGSNSEKATHGNFPGGWSIDWSPASSADEAEERTGLANMAALGHALGHSTNRTRSNTQGSDSPGSHSSRRHPTRLSTSYTTTNTDYDQAYVPPTPTYAISSSDAIPVGYVAHARDACIDVSYQWDSMRSPQCWGHGGEYGEEWSSMHRRFRNGLTKMIEWYEEHGTAVSRAAEMFTDPVEEEETDTVLILVTHGAGCNALLGALTSQPVLLDVGMASLTMAVRKEGAKSAQQRREEIEETGTGTNGNTPSTRKNSRRRSIDLGIVEDYEIKYTASTDHLRAGSNPLAGTAASPRIGATGSISPYRRPATTFSGDSFTIGEGAATYSGRPTTTGPTFGGGGLHRSASGHSALRSTMYAASSAPKVSSGLWRSGTGTVSSSNEGTPSESGAETDSLPNFGGRRKKAKSSGAAIKMGTRLGSGNLDGANELGSALKKVDISVAPDVKVEEQQQEQQQEMQVHGNENGYGIIGASGAVTPSDLMKTPSHTPNRTASHQGLWGGGFARELDIPKRRWTVVENTAG